jgi:hypothetical protein
VISVSFNIYVFIQLPHFLFPSYSPHIIKLRCVKEVNVVLIEFTRKQELQQK